MKITDKYVLREHLGPLLFSLSALTSLLLLNYIAKRFGQLVGKGLPWGVIGEFFLLSIPFTIAMTIPMAVLVATLYAFSRMAAENEITAFKASGVSMRRLMAPVLWAAAALAVGMIVFNDQLLPRANHQLALLQSDILRKKPTFALRPQVTNRVTDRLWLRAGHIHPGSDRMRDVVIYDFSDPERPRTVYADSGRLALTLDQTDLALELYDGVIREFPRGGVGGPGFGGSSSYAGGESSASFQQTFFARNRVLVRDVGNQLQRTDEAGDQIKSDREQTVCELQRSYVRFVRDYEESHAELVALAERATRAGSEITVPPRRRTYEENGLGALYCRLVSALGVQTAFAATTQSPPQSPARPAARATPDPATFGPAVPAAQDTGAPDTARRDPGLPASAASDRPHELELEEETLSPRISSVLLDAAQMRVRNSLEQLNRYDVEIQKKFALAVACVVFVLLGAPIALRFPRGGVGLVIGVSLVVFGMYYVGLIAGETMADKGYLPPWIAMWTANIVFTLVALVLLARMGKEGATSRGGDLGELWESLRGAIARLGRRVGMPLERRRRSVS